ncbi:FadR/GntR family transcriptional regulator [Actinopolymorpha rutila]|uniref:GntR family transcriptional repressor for pyruvate dehydrogenase complex n=1 Tax=Actinopolymorpha rutila TaxID=446787 RepID=A0A852ZGW6_9ACTN|nr:GntR family transcriptional regulator [Actinopolymorpha rutila]NYH92164.1 GntR family transcriptional repressor for pyruvate dehydrogenase complex [Actinopolymorpha rutila]
MIDPFRSSGLNVVSRKRLTDQTAAALRDYILTNRLAVGTRLPAEPSLAQSLGVSRNVLRQAVASLEALGMLRVTQGSGTYVADVADSEVFAQIAAWMGSDGLTEQDYLEVRAIWERGIYELVLDRASASDLDHLDEISSAMVHAEDLGKAATLHEEFHDVLLRATGNQFLVTVGSILHRFFWEFGYRRAQVRKPPAERLLDGHRSIVRLLRTRDPGNIQHMIDLHLSPHDGGDEGADEKEGCAT